MFDWVKDPDSIESHLGDELGSPRRVAKHSRQGRILQFLLVLGNARLRIRAELSLQLYAPELLRFVRSPSYRSDFRPAIAGR